MRNPFSRRVASTDARIEPEVKAALPAETKSAGDDLAAVASMTTPATLANPDPALLELFGIEPGLTGLAFSPRDAMRCTSSRRAIQIIAETIAALPMHIFEVAADGTRERDLSDPNDRLLNLTPNGWQTAVDFREALTRDALIWGAGHAFINRRSADGSVMSLERQIPGRVSTQIDQETGEPSFIVGDRRIAVADMLSIRAPYTLFPTAESPTSDAAEAIALPLVLERYAGQLFANGARPSGVVSFPTGAKVPPDRVTNIGRTFSALHSGRKAGGTAVMTDGAQWTPMTLTSVDAQFIEQRRFAIEEIGRAYGVPPSLLGEMGRATWSNAEEMGRVFVNYTLIPWMRRWEAEINLKLFSVADLGKREVEHDTDSLLRADFVQRMEGNAAAIAARIMNPNEVRSREGLGPYKGGEDFLNPNVQAAELRT